MSAFLPLLAAVLQASSVTLDKAILRMRRVDFREYTGVSFPLIFFITLAAFFIMRPPFPATLLGGPLGLLILASAAMTVVTNIAYYRALDHDRLQEMETLGLLVAIPTVIGSGLLFADERNPAVLIPALIAAGAIVWAHWERHHFVIARRTLPFLLWALAAGPLQAAILKILLTSWHPISLELVRSAITAAVFGILFRNAARSVSFRAFWFLLATNVLSAVAWFLFYFSYQRSGVVYTVLLFSLQPLLVYLGTVVFLREKLQWKKFAAFQIVLGSIIVAELLG